MYVYCMDVREQNGYTKLMVESAVFILMQLHNIIAYEKSDSQVVRLLTNNIFLKGNERSRKVRRRKKVDGD